MARLTQLCKWMFWLLKQGPTLGLRDPRVRRVLALSVPTSTLQLLLEEALVRSFRVQAKIPEDISPLIRFRLLRRLRLDSAAEREAFIAWCAELLSTEDGVSTFAELHALLVNDGRLITASMSMEQSDALKAEIVAETEFLVTKKDEYAQAMADLIV